MDYRLSTDERYVLYEQLNGVYIPGDSNLAITDALYKQAFVDTLDYQEQQTLNQEHFPLFFMGNSLTTLVRALQSNSGHVTSISDLKFQML